MGNFFVVLLFNLLLICQPIFARPFHGTEIVMSAASTPAVEAAQRIAEKGGNVVDVAVSLVLAMSVTHPTFAALGGGGFAIVRMGKSIDVVDFREQAPQATSPDYYKDKGLQATITGGSAVAVPGLPLGLWEIHKKYGKISWQRLFQDPITLAEKGVRISGEVAEAIQVNSARFNLPGKKVFLKETKTAYRPGQLLVQKNLGKLLREMQSRNVISFYQGQVAKDIAKTVHDEGGSLTIKDLADYKVIWRKPMVTEYAGHKIYLMPPPSSGGIVIKTALHLIEKLKISNLQERETQEYHMLGEILNRAFRGRNFVADPEHFAVPTNFLLDKKYLQTLENSIKPERSTPIEPLQASEVVSESAETTHLSVIDKFGNAVSMTITLNGSFGSGVTTEKYGVVLNNEMDDFTTRPGSANMFGLVQGSGNTVAPGKRPLSSMSPTLVEKDGKIVMALGAPGGPRIISSVTQVLYRTLGRKQDLEFAVESPRVHHQLIPNKLYVDKNRFAPENINGLRDKGHFIEESWQGRIFAVQNKDGVLQAVFDTRGEGANGGY